MKFIRLLIFIVLGTMSISESFSQTTLTYSKMSDCELKKNGEQIELETTSTYDVLTTVTFYETIIILTVPEQDFIISYYIMDITVDEDDDISFTVYNYLDNGNKSYGYLSLTNGVVFYSKTNSTQTTMLHN